jgi:membrane peptidoglycan carboxypeptidase
MGLPCAVVEILLLVEDKRFPTHFGVDISGVLRALLANPRKNVLQGASTISQQIFTMRRFALTSTRSDRTVLFKIHQAWWATYQETRSSKVDILTEYVNNVYVGRSHWGLDQAAFGYFNVPLNEISPAQAFFLAERIGSPNSIRPGRLLNLMARVAIRDYFARYSTDAMSVIEVYRSVYGESQRDSVNSIEDEKSRRRQN